MLKKSEEKILIKNEEINDEIKSESNYNPALDLKDNKDEAEDLITYEITEDI